MLPLGNKSAVPGMGYLFGENLSAWSHRSTPTWKSTAIPLGYNPESEDKTLLLKTACISTMEHRDNKFAPDLEASFLLPTFHKARRYCTCNQQFYPAGNPESHKQQQTWQDLHTATIVTEILGEITKLFLIGFKGCSTAQNSCPYHK